VIEKINTLIRTKLHQPFTSQKLVSRPRLETRIAEGLCFNPLTLIIAPAGFGKTTLVTASLDGCGMRSAWLSLDREDNQVGHFLAYLIAALQTADSRIGFEASQLITGVHQVLKEAVLTSLINDLDSLNQETVLVLDDFQCISSQDVLSSVAFLLEHCPLCFHLVIMTRADPLLPLSRLRAHGQMLELRAVDLRFTQDEAVQFLNGVMGLRLDRQAADILEERTEGWAAGLQMAALSIRDREDVRNFIKGFSGTNRYILDFLMEEVMAGQSLEIQHFLLYTSILERLTAPLCDAVLANEGQTLDNAEGEDTREGIPSPVGAASALAYLERENIFLISLDDERTWFRYHHLFSDLLRARLQQTRPGVIPLLHTRASSWLERNGYINEAIEHLLVIRDFEHAASLIERHGPDCLAKSDPSILSMADILPREILISRPKIGLYQAWLQIIKGHIDIAIPLLKDIAQQLTDTDPAARQQWMQAVISTALAFLAPPCADPDVNPLPDEALLEEIPAKEMILRNTADILYGMTLARKGQLERAIDISMKCIRREGAQQRERVIPTLAPFVTRIHLIIGRLHTCVEMCHEYLDPLKERGIRSVYTSGSMKIDLGEAEYEWNRLDEAEECIREGLKSNEPWQNIMTNGFGLTALVRVLMAKGDYPGALQTVGQMETTFQSRALPREFEEDFHTLKVRVQLAGGDLHSAAAWADQVQRSAGYEANSWRYQLTLAHIALAQQRYEDVRKICAETTPAISSHSQTGRQIECRLLLAAALQGLRQHAEAAEILDSCLALAEPEDYVLAFLDEGEPTRKLLVEYLKSDNPCHRLFVQKVVNAFPSTAETGPIKPPQAGLIEPLSGRELEVLTLIAQGRTNEEIARRLIVARGTIKAHAASIYRKLDAANRTEAVTHARKLEIIS
jgi:LuxR family transcriptional regulator, maltose regulon positive regulatory protein